MNVKFMLLISSLLIGPLLFSSRFSFAATVEPQADPQPLVRVLLNQQQQVFTTPPRLAEVLEPVALSRDWYWAASKLFRLDTAEPEQQRQQFLAELQQWVTTTTGESQRVMQRLVNEISQWQLGERIAIPIDYDLARIAPRANPAFTAGAYHLLLTERPANITFFGAMPQVVNVAHRPAASLAEYLIGLNVSQLADTSALVVIQPNGQVIHTGAQAWQVTSFTPMPGAMVIVPFKAGIWGNGFAALNQPLIEIAVNRVY